MNIDHLRDFFSKTEIFQLTKHPLLAFGWETIIDQLSFKTKTFTTIFYFQCICWLDIAHWISPFFVHLIQLHTEYFNHQQPDQQCCWSSVTSHPSSDLNMSWYWVKFDITIKKMCISAISVAADRVCDWCLVYWGCAIKSQYHVPIVK